MRCKACGCAGYNMNKVNPLCQSCEFSSPKVGTGTLVRTNSLGNSGGFGTTFGSISSLPPIANLNEWREIIALCKKVCGQKLLLEDAPIKTLPLPKAHNPLDGQKKEAGWRSLDSYLDGLTNKSSNSKTTNRFLFEG